MDLNHMAFGGRATCRIKPSLWFLCFLTGIWANATPPPSGVAPVTSPAGGFSIDGNLVANLPGNTGDWLMSTNAGTGGAVLDASGAPLNPATTFHFRDLYSSGSDNTFVGGLKWTDNPNVWQSTTSKSSGKTDINNVLLHVAKDSDAHSWVVVAADRASTSGDSYIDFEFLQNSLVLSNGHFVSTGPDGGRTTHDLLLSLAFTGGGSVADFFAWRWEPDGVGGFAYVDATSSLPTGRVFVAANSIAVPVPFGAFGQMTYTPNAFAEAAVDLTALLGNFDPCVSIGFKTIMVKTKTSSSSSATIADHLDPIQYSLRVGPSADAGPDQTRCLEGATTAFPLSGVVTPGLQPISSTLWSVVSGDATIDSPSSLVTTAFVASASATLRLTALQANGCTETNDVILGVVSPPSCSITGPLLVCPKSTNQFSAPAGMSGYSWSILGNGAISGSTNARTVTIISRDTCGQNFTLFLNESSNVCSSACSMDVLVNDTMPPTLSLPADLTLECPADTRTNTTGVAIARDDCSVVTVSYSDSISNICGGSKIISRTWSAIDLCGNSTNAVQTITVRDTGKPSITCPSSRVLECPADTSTNANGVATATDTCSAVFITYSDSVSNTCGGAQVISRTWLATDACGNNASCVQTITVRDTSKPTLTCPPDLVLDCPADTGTNATGVATARDTCSEVTVRYADSVSNSCSGASVIMRTWTATDGCSNSISCVQKITVRDITKPVLTCPPDLVLDCPADTTTNATGVATAQDTCSQVTIRYSDAVTNNCGPTRIIARTWTATDACSNSISCTQTITVRDISKPTISCPPDLVLECPAVTTTNATGVATAQDTCSQVTIRYSDAVTNNCGGTKVIARTWTATDLCSNNISCVQTITVVDRIRPSLVSPANVTLECPADTRTNMTGAATAQDGCGQVTVSYADSVTNTCGGAKIIARMWTAIDQCGNSTNRVQTITVRDGTKPVITCPPNRSLACPADTSTNANGVATATDTCSAVLVTYSDSVSNGCTGTKVIARTWTATDACGNSASCVQTITVSDTILPTLTCPPDLVLECPADTGTNATGVATAQDTCSRVTVRYSDAVTNGCSGTSIIARTWTATDECGNSISCVQKLTVRDTTKPVITCPPNLVLECPADTTTNATGMATAQDTCSQVTIRYVDSVTNNCGGTKVIARTWSATDACSNSASCTQTITVRDVTKPTLIIPGTIVLECPATDISTNVTGSATAQDGCGSVTVNYADAVTNNCGATKVITRTWTATDQCGNTTNRVQLIIVRDTTRPTIVCPPSVVLECPADISTNANGAATAQDACSSVTIRYSDSVSNICGNARVISRTWTATDACGNAISCIQTITVRDTVSPVITRPADLVLECGASTAPSATGAATATDACSGVTVTYSDSVSNNCGGSRVISRTWTAVDQCGNNSSSVQTITLRDRTPPSLRLPADLVLQCPGDTRTNVTGVPLAVDVCSSVTLSYSDVVSNSCGATRTVWRSWTATDACGNSTNGMQIITVVDTTKPSISCPRVSVQCVDDVPLPYVNLAAFLAGGGTATDSCSSPLTFSQTSNGGLVGRCPGTVTRVYRVVDACGNFAECTQTITVDDTIAPVLTCPASITVECGNSLDPSAIGSATATDNCSSATITHSDSVVQGQYNLSFLVADPDSGTGPYSPTYLKFAPGSLPCPESARLTGRALDPLRNAVAYAPGGQLDALTSIGNVPMAFGQIVPYEVVIEASGGPGAERGTIEFTADWHTYTTSNNRFGYDTNYMIYCAFVDAADPGSLDPNRNARVESYSSRVVNTGSIDEAIRGTFRVSGLDAGDRVVVEIWVVLMPNMPEHSGGTVAASLVSAQTAANPPVSISIGTQTDSLGNLSKIFPLPAPQEQPPLGPLPQQPPVLPGATVNVIDRTWSATDDCGNTSTCVQRITVRDTTPPVLSLPPSATLDCPGTDVSTNVTGTAIASDLCGSVKLYYSDIVSNGCGNTRVISRTWVATDEAGNSTNALQTITVSSRPAITCPPDLVLECPADTGPIATGVAAAQDTCSQVIVSYSDAVTTGCGGSLIIARTWTAINACGISTNCTQTITVRDTRPPALICQPNRTVLAPKAWTFTEPSASDTCSAVTVQVMNTTTNWIDANTLSVTRTWIATDACGNTNQCQQTITVLLGSPPTITSSPQSQTVMCGGSLGLSVTAASTTPCTYQWRLGGLDIPGATGSTFVSTNTGFSSAGLYCAVVANAAGAVTSAVAVVDVAAEITVQRNGTSLILTWPAPFILQSALKASGPYSDEPGATSPFTYNTVSGPMKFFRLRSPTYSFTAAYLPGGQFSLTCTTAVPGCNFVFQASTDLVHWSNLETNITPVVFKDAEASAYPNRFYRAVMAH